MEQRKSTFTSFIKPFINKLQVSQEEYEERDVFFKPTVMPLIDVVEQIHHSFYFKKPIVLHFEKYDNAGRDLNRNFLGCLHQFYRIRGRTLRTESLD